MKLYRQDRKKSQFWKAYCVQSRMILKDLQVKKNIHRGKKNPFSQQEMMAPSVSTQIKTFLLSDFFSIFSILQLKSKKFFAEQQFLSYDTAWKYSGLKKNSFIFDKNSFYGI